MKFVTLIAGSMMAASLHGCSEERNAPVARAQGIGALRAAGRNTADINAFNERLDAAVADVRGQREYGARKAAARKELPKAASVDLDDLLGMHANAALREEMEQVGLGNARRILEDAGMAPAEVERQMAIFEAELRAAHQRLEPPTLD